MLDLQSGYWQIKMSLKDVRNTTLITKFGPFDWNFMLFGKKNAISTFSKFMIEAFGEQMDKFSKVFVEDLNTQYDLGRSFATFLICDDEIERGEPKARSQQM